MAETNFVIPEKAYKDFLDLLIRDGQVAFGSYDKSRKKTVSDYASIWEDLSSKMCQVFIKNPAFANDRFSVKEVDNVHMGKIFTIDQFRGEGHLTLVSSPIKSFDVLLFSVDIKYNSFFILPNQQHIKPSNSLVQYYKKIVKSLKENTEKFQPWEGKNVWVSKQLLADISLVASIKHHFKLSDFQ